MVTEIKLILKISVFVTRGVDHTQCTVDVSHVPAVA